MDSDPIHNSGASAGPSVDALFSPFRLKNLALPNRIVLPSMGFHVAEDGIPGLDVAEYYRVLGTLCGQVAAGNILTGLSYGKRAQDAINKAVEKDPKSPTVYVARGVGNYYLPPALGGGVDLAIADFRKALSFNPKDAEAYLWLGLSLRKQNKNAEARDAFTKSLELNPNRIWVKQQLDKTPAK